jgi:cysteine desulfurase
LLVARGEHHATIEAAEWLRDHQGAQIVWLEIDHAGVLQPATLAAAIERVGAEHVALASFLWVNNEVGSVLPVVELCRIAEGSGIPTHIDAVAALGQIPISFAAAGASALSVSAHKIGGPLGFGALILGRHAKADSLLHGGSQQRARSGSQNVAGAVAFAAALDHTLTADGGPDPARTGRLADLRDRLIEGVREIDSTAVLRGSTAPGARVPGNAHFTFPGCQGDSLVFLLDAVGVSVSVGSACQAGVAEISHVLLAMGLSEAEAAGALRFTLGPETLDDEVDALLAALPDAIARARSAGLN